MTGEQAKEFIAKYPNAKSFVKPSHLEELSQLLEVHIEAITVRKDEFHELEGGKTYMPRKETTDKFGGAAGVSYNQAAETTRMEGDGVFVGRSQAMVIGPDGKPILGSACEYEFNVDVRLAELELNQKYDYDTRQKRPYTELELKKERVQLMKVGRQRANTGARSRATVSILGMQTGFKGLFQKNDPDTKTATFLFSRIIVNAKNELVMNRMLDGIAGNTAALFGPQASKALSAPAAPAHESGFRDVTPAAQPEEDDLFGPAPAPKQPDVDPRITKALEALREYQSCDGFNQKQRDAIQDVFDRGESDPIILEAFVARVRAAYEKIGAPS